MCHILTEKKDKLSLFLTLICTDTVRRYKQLRENSPRQIWFDLQRRIPMITLSHGVLFRVQSITTKCLTQSKLVKNELIAVCIYRLVMISIKWAETAQKNALASIDVIVTQLRRYHMLLLYFVCNHLIIQLFAPNSPGAKLAEHGTEELKRAC